MSSTWISRHENEVALMRCDYRALFIEAQDTMSRRFERRAVLEARLESPRSNKPLVRRQLVALKWQMDRNLWLLKKLWRLHFMEKAAGTEHGERPLSHGTPTILGLPRLRLINSAAQREIMNWNNARAPSRWVRDLESQGRTRRS